MGKARSLELDIKAYEMAKEIERFTTSYSEAIRLTDAIKNNFEWARTRTKVQLPEYPVDSWGDKVNLPETEVPGSEDK